MNDSIIRKFRELAELVMAKAAKIVPSTIVRFWRHCIVALCQYIALQKIDE